MKILALEKEITKHRPSNYGEILEQEAKHVWALQQEGILREIYFTQNKNAVLILECKDLSEAEKLVSAFPLAKEKIISFELSKLLPYSGFKKLLK